jgi:hypothetical protein
MPDRDYSGTPLHRKLGIIAGPAGQAVPAAAGAIGADGGIWVAWPKKASGVATDLDFGFVQQVGLDAGLADLTAWPAR